MGFGGLHGRGAKKQDPPIERELALSLEEVYHGCTKKMKISRRVMNEDGHTSSIRDKILTITVKRGWKPGVRCHFSLHAKLPFRGKMEWNSIPFYPCRVEWNGNAIPFCPFPVHISPARYFPMQNMRYFVFAMGKYIAFYVVLITELVTIPTVVVVIVVIQITCNHNCSCIF